METPTHSHIITVDGRKCRAFAFGTGENMTVTIVPIYKYKTNARFGLTNIYGRPGKRGDGNGPGPRGGYPR